MLKDLLKSLYPASDNALEDYLSYWRPVTFRRKDFLLREGEVQHYLYFVESGVQKSFFIKDNKEFIVAFTHGGSFCASPRSFYTVQPSPVFIECITDSTFIRIQRDRHLEMLEKYPDLSTVFRIGAELILAGVVDRYSELMALSIEERFRSFASRSPQLLNIIPHKDLASYLRIDPSNFSKLFNSVKL